VQYFSNKFPMIDHGEFVNCVAIMFFQLVKELIKWEKCPKKRIEGTTKRKQKKGCVSFCHSA